LNSGLDVGWRESCRAAHHDLAISVTASISESECYESCIAIVMELGIL
jgi:hypothetical protein